jgi:hypothetical protein
LAKKWLTEKIRDRLFGFTHGTIHFKGIREYFAFAEVSPCEWAKPNPE